ncbi:hypothetical protein AMATHDRAFT_967 [Amanita thiersii Skay4041]|uniref:DUF6533 domain-containing protein n=1 Tax=Amanita thiersii Skay4041 TaxID=703135 RepID=A0A2A9NRW6_9AGAR|nr:hypothetical protein AMATHDRAFT_967 [Amanita thiersii Skay4041]
MPTLPPELLVGLQHKKITSYTNIVGVTILVFDHLLTFGLEFEHIWKSKWTVFKGMFLFMRYIPYVDIFLVLYQDHRSDMSAKTCLGINSAYSFLFIIGIAGSEYILTMRTWAVWDRNRWIGVGLLVFVISLYTYGFTNMALFLETLSFHDADVSKPFSFGCIVKKGARTLSINWILLLVYDAALCLLLMIRAYQEFRNGGKSRLWFVIYRDGIVYYNYLFVLSLMTVVFIEKLPPDFLPLLSVIARAVHPVLTARVVLNAREATKNIYPDTNVLTTVDVNTTFA